MLENKSVEEITSSIKSRKIKIVEVISSYLERIKKYNPQLNAIVSIKDEEKIIEEAKTKDLEKNYEFNKDLLVGLPLAIKDINDAEGLPTTFGVKEYKNNFPTQNSIIVERLIKNGAIIIGKTNTAELALGSHTTNRLYGPTSNVYTGSKSSGGSSGGAASAVAASLVPIADGTDMMGSCRNPAAYANLYGFRPTPGLIPSKRNNKLKSELNLLTTSGFIARTPNDMSIILDAVSGKDPIDPFSFDIKGSFRETIMQDNEFRSLKIGWLSDMNGHYKFDHGILEMCEKALSNIDSYSSTLDIESLKTKIDPSDIWDIWTSLRAKCNFDDLKEMKLLDMNNLCDSARWEYLKGANIKSNQIEKSILQQNKYLNEVHQLFKKFDFIILPSAQVFPFNKEKSYPDQICGYNLDTYHRWMEVTILSGLFQLPTISVPIGFNEEGLPMGMQIIGKKGNDLKVISFAKKYEETFNLSKIKPKKFFN